MGNAKSSVAGPKVGMVQAKLLPLDTVWMENYSNKPGYPVHEVKLEDLLLPDERDKVMLMELEPEAFGPQIELF